MGPKTKRLTTWADIVSGRTVRFPTGNDSRRIQSDRVRRPGKGNPPQIVSAPEKLIYYEDLDIPLVDEEIKKPIVNATRQYVILIIGLRVPRSLT